MNVWTKTKDELSELRKWKDFLFLLKLVFNGWLFFTNKELRFMEIFNIYIKTAVRRGALADSPQLLSFASAFTNWDLTLLIALPMTEGGG